MIEDQLDDIPEDDQPGRCPVCGGPEQVVTPIMSWCAKCRRNRHVDAKPPPPLYVNAEASRRRLEMATLRQQLATKGLPQRFRRQQQARLEALMEEEKRCL